MATTRRKVRSLTDLNAKQNLQKVDGNDVIFEASGSLASGKVTVNVPLSASAGLAVSGAAGLIVNQGGVTISGGDLRLNNNAIKSSSGFTAITLNSTDVKTEGDLIVGAGHIKVGTNTESIILDSSTGRADFQGGVRITGSTTTSGSLTIGGNGTLTANAGATINGSALTANAGVVVNNSALLVTNGGISGSATLQAGGDLTVGGDATIRGDLDVQGNMTVRGTPTIINTEVLEVKDNIIVVNKVSGSEAAYVSASAGIYVNRGNYETASLLWVSSSNDWQFQATTGGTPASADLVVNKLKPVLISGSAGVAVNSSLTIAATASLHTSASFNYVSIPTSSVVVEGTTYKIFNIDDAIHAIDAALQNAGLSAASVQSAYRALRFQYSGTLDANGEWSGSLPLTQESGKAAFPTSSFNHITTDVMIDESGRWINDLVAVDMEVSSSAVWVTISAAAAPNTGFRLIAVNENTASYSVA